MRPNINYFDGENELTLEKALDYMYQNNSFKTKNIEKYVITKKEISNVKEKYNETLKSTEKTLLDQRCPLAIDTIREYINEEETLIPQIDPILIHCGIEIANREDLKGKKKIITTPCESLASYGNKKKGLSGVR